MKSFAGVLVLFGFVALVGCGDKKDDFDGVVVDPVVSKPAPLGGKEVGDLLAVKYNKVELTCELRTQRGAAFDETAPANEAVTWDLLEAFALTKTFTLKGNAGDAHSVKMNLSVDDVQIIESVTHTAADGTVYSMDFTPVISLSYEFESATSFEPGVTSVMTETSQRKINENIPMKAFTSAESTELTVTAGSYFDDFRCLLTTEHKPEYKDQFAIVSEISN